jgi:hypothetical protein
MMWMMGKPGMQNCVVKGSCREQDPGQMGECSLLRQYAREKLGWRRPAVVAEICHSGRDRSRSAVEWELEGHFISGRPDGSHRSMYVKASDDRGEVGDRHVGLQMRAMHTTRPPVDGPPISLYPTPDA